MAVYTISKIAKEFGLSRTTLIYYDSIGLLKPARSEKKYRIYSESDKKRLEHICTYRDMGLPLKEIQILLSESDTQFINILENHLSVLSDKIRQLRKQQHSIVKLLQDKSLLKHTGVMDKETWVSILRASGMSDKDMDNWHRAFELQSPQAHQEFLISLGLGKAEIELIRRDARNELE